MIGLTISIDKRGVDRLEKKLRDDVPANLSVATKKFAFIARDEIKRQFMRNKKRAPRGMMAKEFKVIKKNNYEFGVSLPVEAINLDRMRPHYVALRRGRKITEWTRKYFGSSTKTGKSRVYYGPGGGIKPKSALYVTPDPFIEAGFERAINRLDSTFSKAVKQALRG